MRFIKLSTAFFAVALLSTACGMVGVQRDETARQSHDERDVPQAEAAYEPDVRYVRENLDLRAVGGLLERADNAEELEYLLNSEGVNNLDLNRDGYVDYVSVSEFEDRYDDERGLSLFSRFGPDLIQEIATIIFDREGSLNSPGARILLRGDEQLYGDDYYYETNWLDRSLPITNWLFDGNRDQYYQSPYYYGNYPDSYEIYQPVETPVYRTRIEEFYSAAAAPVFIQTSSPATVGSVRIKSPYDGRTVSRNELPKSDKLSKEEKEFRKNNRADSAEFEPVKRGKIKDIPPGLADDRPRGNPNNFEKPRKSDSPRFEPREKPDKVWKDAVKAAKVERPAFNQPKPNKAEKQNMKPPKADNGGGGGGGKQKGGGNGKGGGKGNGGGGGGGKGGGKKN